MSPTTVRDSVHIRLSKAETLQLHKKLSVLTNRPVDCFETVKLIRYNKGGRFSAHADRHRGEYPGVINRDLTCFIYLNDVLEGGETIFFITEGGYNAEVDRACADPDALEKRPDIIAHRVKPE